MTPYSHLVDLVDGAHDTTPEGSTSESDPETSEDVDVPEESTSESAEGNPSNPDATSDASRLKVRNIVRKIISELKYVRVKKINEYCSPPKDEISELKKYFGQTFHQMSRTYQSIFPKY